MASVARMTPPALPVQARDLSGLGDLSMSTNTGGRFVAFGAAGAAIGVVIGLVMRPTILGMKIPLSVLTSSHPGDAPFRSEMLTQLALYLVAGAGIGCVVAFALTAMMPAGTRAAAAAPPAPYDLNKWQALVEIDPEIAAQAKRIAPFGQHYVDELAQKYLSIGDKAYLAQIADAIASKAGDLSAKAEAAMTNKDNRFLGFRCFHDGQGRFVGEVEVNSGNFHIFRSPEEFEEAVRNYVARGRPPIASSAIARLAPDAATA